MSSHAKQTSQFLLQEGKYAVNSARQKIQGPRSAQVVIGRVALNHYVTKSLDEFLQKIARGSGMGNQKTMHFFRQVQASATHNCSYSGHSSMKHE